MIKAVIFDLDGTLLNTLEDLTYSTNFALRELNYPEKTINEVCDYVGNGVAVLIERALPEGRNNVDFERCLELFKQHYSKNMENNTQPYSGIIELLNNLKINNYKIAVVSNKFDLAVKNLCQKYFTNLIDIAIGENEKSGIKKKPSPDTVNKVLAELKINCKNAVYIGDSDVDIMTAQNAKMPVISVTWGFRDEDFLLNSGAKIIVRTPEEIISAIKTLG